MREVNIKYMKEALVRDMVIYVCEKYSMSLPDAMNVVYSSDTFRLLEREDTQLYAQSTVYLNECLERELKTGKIYG